MMTVHGMAEDDAEHERICSEYRKGVAFAGWKNERVVATFGLNKSRNGLGIGMGMGMGILGLRDVLHGYGQFSPEQTKFSG